MPITPSSNERIYLLPRAAPSADRTPGIQAVGGHNQPVCTESEIKVTIEKFNQLPANERQAIAMSTETSSLRGVLIKNSFEDIAKATGLNEAEVPNIIGKMSTLDKRILEIIIPGSDGILSRGAPLGNIMPESQQAARITGIMKNGAKLDQYVLSSQVPVLQETYARQLVDGQTLKVTVPAGNTPSSSTMQQQPYQQHQQRHQPTNQEQARQRQQMEEQQARQSQYSREVAEGRASPRGSVVEMPGGVRPNQGSIELGDGTYGPAPEPELAPRPKLGPQLVQKAPPASTAVPPKSNLVEMPRQAKTAPHLAGSPPEHVSGKQIEFLKETPEWSPRISQGMEVASKLGGRVLAVLPVATGAWESANKAAAEHKSKSEIALAGAKGGIKGALGGEDFDTVRNSKEGWVDRTLAGGRSAAMGTAVVTGVGGAEPVAVAALGVNLGLGVVQDLAHWTGLAKNPGTIGHTIALIDEYQKLTANNKTGIQPDNVALKNLTDGLQSKDPGKASEALTRYQYNLTHRYQQNAQLTNNPAEKQQATDALTAANKLARNLFDQQQKNGFQPIPPPAAQQQVAAVHHKAPGLN